MSVGFRHGLMALLCVLAGGAAQAAGSEAAAVVRAAHTFERAMVWQEASVVVGDFTCQGKDDYAILGVVKPRRMVHEGVVIDETLPEVALAIFNRGLSARPAILRFPARDVATVRLAVEDLETQPPQRPEGWRPSRVCKGLTVGEGEADAAHIYWNRTRRQFSVWRLQGAAR